MRPLILICLFVILGCIANAQFTITPQIGFESSKTSVEINELSSFYPAGVNSSPQAGIRLDYKFKQLHGPYLGMSTSRTIVRFNFTDPATAMNDYTTSRGNTQLRLEGGYQVSSKPIYFKCPGSVNKSSAGHCQRSAARMSCGSKSSKSPVASPAGKGSWVSIQPSAGVAFIPFSPTTEIYTKSSGSSQGGYEYNAGNWKTAFVTGVGFEFGKNDRRTFVVSVNYLKSMGNLAAETTTMSGNKPASTRIESGTSAWNLRIGIPIGLNKSKPAVKPAATQKNYKTGSRCGQYRPRCHKVM